MAPRRKAHITDTTDNGGSLVEAPLVEGRIRGAKGDNNAPSKSTKQEEGKRYQAQHPQDPTMEVKQRYFSSITKDDILFEEELLKAPYHLKSWLRYADHKAESPLQSRICLYERAVQELPRSYKLWKAYLDLRVGLVVDKSGGFDESNGLYKKLKVTNTLDPEWEKVNNCFERALVMLNKMPVVWLDYCHFLMHQQVKISHTRRTFDRALKSLPITQHHRIWKLYLQFASNVGGETALRIWKRYLKLDPFEAEDYVALLVSRLDPPRYAEAARVLASLVEDPTFQSKYGKTHFKLWTELCELICDHPDEVNEFEEVDDENTEEESRKAIKMTDHGDVNSTRLGKIVHLDIEKVLRTGISKFSEQVGKLWNTLAKWYILQGEFDKARDVYEEAITKVMTIRDFSMIFDAYAEFEESVISLKMQSLAGVEDDDTEDRDEVDVDEIELDLRLARFERLMERRPFLVNDVLLRQNPHNVLEWEKRVALWKEKGDFDKVVDTYTRALATVQPRKAHGKMQQLWIHFAEFYEQHGDLDTARVVMEKGIDIPFKTVDDLAEVWCQWAEMELRHDYFENALKLMGRATAPPPLSSYGKQIKSHFDVRYSDESYSPQLRLFKSLKLWSFYVDLEESLGTVESTKLVYDRILELRIATPQIIINYAAFLEENKYFEDSFKVYERGLELFGYPVAYDVWNLYLTKFIKRYGGAKLERARDLFEQALEKCPAKYCKSMFLLYAKLEEDHGLAKNAMRIYDRATRAVPDSDRMEMFTIYISRATSFFGIVSTREIYQRSIESLPDRHARDMCLRFADMETKLGEVDRSRAILAYGSQLSDPRMDSEYWKRWQEFEVKYGNEETFKEMLRIKRSVQAKFNTDVTFISQQLLTSRQGQQTGKAEVLVNEEEGKSRSGNVQLSVMEQLEQQAIQQKPITAANRISAGVQFVKATVTGKKRVNEDDEIDKGSDLVNPDEIVLDDIEDGSDGDGEDGIEDEERQGKDKVILEQKSVPSAVFGGLKEVATSIGQYEESLGAKERFKRKR